MDEELVFRSTSDVRSALRLQRAGRDTWVALLDREGLSARTSVYAYAPHGDMTSLFTAMAQDWRGWEGEKRWESLEGELELRCHHDRVGHVRMHVRLCVDGWPGSWIATGVIELEAGALDRIASEVSRFLAS